MKEKSEGNQKPYEIRIKIKEHLRNSKENQNPRKIDGKWE